MQVCDVQEKLATFELIYGSSLMDHWYSVDMKDMFKNLIEILNHVCRHILTPADVVIILIFDFFRRK